MNGWTPATVTLDADGNVLSVTVMESRFTPDDVETLLASRRVDGSYNEFGIPNSEAMDPDNQFRFKVVGPRMDYAAETVRRAQALHRSQNKDADDMSSLRWSVEKI